MRMRRKIIYGVGIFFAIWAVLIGVISFLEWRDNTKFERNMTKIDKMVEDREKELAKVMKFCLLMMEVQMVLLISLRKFMKMIATSKGLNSGKILGKQ